MKVENLSFKHHREGPYFFKNLSFELKQGFLHALYGKNGTGKTVLFQLLAEKYHAAFVNQRFDQMLADQFTFQENLKFAKMAKFPSLFSLSEPFSYLEVAEKFHIDPKVPVKNLSGGQRQILALLMMLQKKVDYLLLDEPTAALDAENAVMVFEFLKTLVMQGMTLFAVCHDQDLLEEYTSGNSFYLVREP